MRPWPSVDFPPNQPVITNLSYWSRRVGKAPLGTSGTWGTANRIIYCPFIFDMPGFWAGGGLQIGWYGGAANAGQINVGIYAPDSEGKPGAKIDESGLGAAVGTSIWQIFNLGSGNPPRRGLSYFAMICTDANQTVMRILQAGTTGVAQIAGGMYTEAGAAGALPATATPSLAFVDCAVPMIGLKWT